MLKDLNVERYIEEAINPVLNHIKELKSEVKKMKHSLCEKNLIK